MDRLEQGTISIEPTDNNYKIYIMANPGTDLFNFIHSYNFQSKTWQREKRRYSKFYFQHLSEEQKKRFVELVNEKKIKIDSPGYFYVLPFFMCITP